VVLLRNTIFSLGPVLILWYYLSDGKGTRGFVRGMLEARTGQVHCVKLVLQAVVCGGLDSIELARDRDRGQDLVKSVMNLRVP